MKKLVQIKNLKKYFKTGRRQVRKAVNDITFDIYRGETLGLVGESGCGKTTLGKIIVRLYKPTSGQVIYDGIDVHKTGSPHNIALNKHMQMVFQDPYASLNPRMTAGEIIGEAIDIHSQGQKGFKRERVIELLQTVGLHPGLSGRYPHEFSGGQRQRIAIARALAVEPDFIVCDEPLTALDASIQAQIVNLLEDLQKQKELTYLFISHDLSMVRHICNRIAVMYLGQVVELASKDELFEHPLHPYTQAVLSAIPAPDPDLETTSRRVILPGEASNTFKLSSGCGFNSRCPKAEARCRQTAPVLSEKGSGHWAACHLS
ncbi:ABC transporter ATP-binding protein [Pelotomaculum propionicicum]|uniref:Oligopeptide transport ATP-binding protein OppF n=1 Tax=Pelotomaculum propionicicum TaxID=258475 RepID=A0A4Y7RKS0_9FIRM|nr:ABC transporter ATP-binding protein [Pelotomaculum propionicicum]TEB09282.1 Oligopeptide transport ATP-binding protein OppF [Pelotomaculum propionicicum]